MVSLQGCRLGGVSASATSPRCSLSADHQASFRQAFAPQESHKSLAPIFLSLSRLCVFCDLCAVTVLATACLQRNSSCTCLAAAPAPPGHCHSLTRIHNRPFNNHLGYQLDAQRRLVIVHSGCLPGVYGSQSGLQYRHFHSAEGI